MCIIDCDLILPRKFHGEFKEMPPCPETLTPYMEWLSDFQRDVGTKIGVAKAGSYKGTNKVVPRLFEHTL